MMQQAMKFSKYGINAVFDEPLERQSTLKLVRSTQMLVLHEFRRYARIPVITELTLVVNGTNRFTGSSQEISASDLAQRVLTFSTSSPAVLGDRASAMLQDIEQRLLPFSRDGMLTEVVLSSADIVR